MRDPSEPKHFLHSGGAGDVIYSLPFIRQAGGGILHIKAKNILNSNCNVFAILKRLLLRQPYIFDVVEYPSAYGFSEYDPRIPVEVDLDCFRKSAAIYERLLPLTYFDQLHVIPEKNWSRPWLTLAPADEIFRPLHDRGSYAIVNRTLRYRDPKVNWKTVLIEAARKHGWLYFVGLQDEHADLTKEIGFQIPWLPTKDLLEVAGYISGADAVYCNQSAALTIAQALGKPYYLEVAPRHRSCIFGAHRGPNEHLLNG